VKGKCDKCGGELYQRSDDIKETIKKRIGVYFTETTPLFDYYNRVDKLLEIDGEGNTEEVGDRIIDSLNTAFVKPARR
ncbi:adenylate kinase family protein, partial [Chloroflexota bacterium]